VIENSVPLLVMALLAALAYLGERRVWNGGVCSASGEPWRHFDTDSMGGRGYTDGAGHTCWISWQGIDKGSDHRG